MFHDDQHGTANITSAALINSIQITKKNITKIKVVVNGAGASAMACSDLFIKLGVKRQNLTMLDSKGVINSNRKGLNKWKLKYATKTKNEKLEDDKRTIDEVGEFFNQMKAVQDELNRYMLPENYGKEESES
mgnify:CR=1 FL=1